MTLMLSAVVAIGLTIGMPIQNAAAPKKVETAKSWSVQVRLVTTSAQGLRERDASFTLSLADDRFLLDLGAVRIYGERAADAARLLAWHTHDPTTYFMASGSDLAPLIRRELPPIWSGPLARWLTREPDPYPLVGHDWPEMPTVSIDEESGMRQQMTSTVMVRTPDQAPRQVEPGTVMKEFITTDQPAGQSTLNIEYTAIAPTPPETWTVETGQRQRVSTIRALRPKPAQIQPGEIVGSLRLFDLSRQQVELRQAFQPERTPRGERRAEALLLIFERSESIGQLTSADITIPEQIAHAREQLAVDAATLERPRPLLIVRPVVVFHSTEFSPASLEAFQSRWSALLTDALLDRVEQSLPSVLWTHPSRDTIDLFTPGADRAAVLIDRNGRLRNVLRLDESTEDLSRWLVREMTASPQVGSDP